MKCKNCGKNFIKSHHAQMHCSPHCRVKYAQRAKYNRRCKMCGKKFISKSVCKLTCSSRCFHNLMSAESKSRYDQALQMVEKVTCVICGSEMEVDKFHKWKKFCAECGYERARQMAADRCKKLTDGWVKKHIFIKSKGKVRHEQITREMINETRMSIIEYRGRKLNKIGKHCRVYFPACVICGSVFTSRSKTGKACSGACRVELYGRQSRESSKRRYIRHPLPGLDNCLECGGPIERSISTRKRYFCGERCAKRFRKSGKLKGFDIIDIVMDYPEIAEEYRALRFARRVIFNKYTGGKSNV